MSVLRLALTALLTCATAGCATPEADRETFGSHPLAVLGKAPRSDALEKETAPPIRQTVGSEQQRQAFEPLETYVSLTHEADMLAPPACRKASESAASELRRQPPDEPALRLALVAGCPTATAEVLWVAAEQLSQLLGREVDGPAALPPGHDAFVGMRRQEIGRRLALSRRLGQQRTSLAERDAEIETLREQLGRFAAETRQEQQARAIVTTELARAREALAAAREKIEAVSRIERAVQQAGEAVDVQTQWSEMAPPGAGPVLSGEATLDTAPSDAVVPAVPAGAARRTGDDDAAENEGEKTN